MSGLVANIARKEVQAMVYWVSYVIVVMLLFMQTDDLLFSSVVSLYVLFFFWPVVFLLDLLVAFIKAIVKK